MWTENDEKDFLNEATVNVWAEINCSECDYSYKALFKKKGNCPNCGTRLRSNTPQQRNGPVGNFTENFVYKKIQTILNKSPKIKGLEAKREVTCEELDLTGRSGADVAIVHEGRDGTDYPANEIEMVLEVKMSLIFNWEPGDNGDPVIVGDYDAHTGRPSIARTDSILKAIGKAGIFRAHKASTTIPYIVVGNCPPPTSYYDKIDGSVRAGITQKFISLTANPIPLNGENAGTRNPDQTPKNGFERIDTLDELQSFLECWLTEERFYIGAFLKDETIGTIIKSIDMSQAPEQIGQAFVESLYQ
jgi:hypothetical protein